MKSKHTCCIVFAIGILSLAPGAFAFNSGSTGTQDLSPTVSTEVALPENGVLEYRNVNIPAGVTITFKKNRTNTPVVILASGDVTIVGAIDLSGTTSTLIGPLGDGNVFDDGRPGTGGPGGFDGGVGGRPSATLQERIAAAGLGPGGGTPVNKQTGRGGVGGGGGFGGPGGAGGVEPCVGIGCTNFCIAGGSTYGTSDLQPMVGGSGGAGGNSQGTYAGSGGGGGGGGILIAASGTVTLAPGGAIRANGASVGSTNQLTAGGGAGSGGAIRIVATRFTGVGGLLSVTGGGNSNAVNCFSGGGGGGRVSLEADLISSLPTVNVAGSSAGGDGTFRTGQAAPVFLAGNPSLRFQTVGGVAVPAQPAGTSDLTLPGTMPNPVTVSLTTSGIPLGSVIRVGVAPANGVPVMVDSTPTAGTLAAATANANIDIPVGHSTLQASVTFTITAALGDALSRFAQGERVEKVTLSTTLGAAGKATLHTVGGKQFEIEPALLAVAGMLP